MKLSDANIVVQPINLNPSYLTNLVKEVVVGSTAGYLSACSLITFDGLDGNTDDGYVIECEVVNPVASSKDLAIYCNNDTTPTNYWREWTRSYGTTVGAINDNTASIFNCSASVKTFGIINVSRTFLAISQHGNKNTGTNGYAASATVWKVTEPSNITRIDLKINDGTAALGIGSRFRVYRRKLNPSLIMTNRYLSNMVEEKKITADCSSVTFSGLDSNLDGDYYLEANIINATTDNHSIRLYVNGDATDANYKTSLIYSAYTTSVTAEANANPGLPPLQASSQMALMVHARCIGGNFNFYYQGYDQLANGNPCLVTGCGNKTATITNITSLIVSDITGAGIKAGSTFRLYKSNSGAVRPGPGFSAVNSVDQTGIASVTWTKVINDSEEWDTHSCYNTANSRFQPNVAGIYSVNYGVRLSSIDTGTRAVIVLYKNGVTTGKAVSAYSPTTNSLPPHLAHTVSVYLNGSTDYIESWVYHDSSGSRTITAGNAYFQAQKIG